MSTKSRAECGTVDREAMYCRKCGYVLRQVAEHRCPECGQGFDPSEPGTYHSGAHTVKWLRAVRWTAGVTACLLLVYVAGYAILVKGGVTPPEYRAGGRLAQLTFVPIHWLDQRVRRGHWTSGSQELRNAFNTADAAKRRAAIEALSARSYGGNPDYTRVYRMLLADPTPEVRQAAVRAIGRHGGEQDILKVKACVQDEDALVQSAARLALSEIQERVKKESGRR